MKTSKLMGMLVLAGSICVNAAFAADEKAATPAASEQKMSPEMQAKMAEMEKYTTPNENHKQLETFIGNWKVSMQCWMTGDAKPEMSEGTSSIRWIMGGRFFQEDFKGMSMGKPFEGMGIVGYDTIRGEYTSTWLDNMATGIMVGSGQYDAATNTFNENSTMSCPLTMEKHRSMRSVIQSVDADHVTREMYMKDKDGKEFKMMELHYERVK